MKLFVASDIHGSALFCGQMLAAFEREGADKLLLLGDILYHGPRNDLPQGYAPKQVIELLNEYQNKILCVRGNCDAEVDQMVLKFPIMADYSVLQSKGRTIYATHGHIYNEERLLPLGEGDILLHGHTHVPVWLKHEHYEYMNPGSVSIPKNNSHHGYMMIEDGRFTWKDLSGKIVEIEPKKAEG